MIPLSRYPLLLSLPEPAFIVGPDRAILEANVPAAVLLGRDRQTLVGHRLEELLANGEEADGLERFLRLCRRSREYVPGVLTLASNSGQPLVTRADGGRFDGHPGDPAGMVFLRLRPRSEASERFGTLSKKVMELSKEILVRKRTEQERDILLTRERAARAEAERIGRIKDEFLATLSHELRTPLTAILGWAHLLQTGQLGPSEMAEGLDAIERNARVQAQLIEDLLDMSRIISGKIRLDVQRVDLAAVVDTALDTVRPAADAKGITLVKVLDPQAGPISGDPARLHQILVNLLSNAVKFTPRGGRVQAVLRRVESQVEVSVIDNGEGVRPDLLPHIFERFRQADSSTTRRHGGLGLGLAIVGHLTELHGGTVRAHSAGEGQGAAFTVSLPLVAVQAPAPEEESHPTGNSRWASAPAVEIPGLEGLRVLVVDDEPDARSMLRRMLEGWGVRVATAASAAEGISMLAQEPPDVLVSDIGMPEEDGYALIRRVRGMDAGKGGKVPAVALTAFARSEDRQQALLAGFQMHLAKPVEPGELAAVLASLGGRSG
ncbi:MAG TPA: ATP-binding protein [bacterium]|nr:ATP-binding protein [bacterium]